MWVISEHVLKVHWSQIWKLVSEDWECYLRRADPIFWSGCIIHLKKGSWWKVWCSVNHCCCFSVLSYQFWFMATIFRIFQVEITQNWFTILLGVPWDCTACPWPQSGCTRSRYSEELNLWFCSQISKQLSSQLLPYRSKHIENLHVQNAVLNTSVVEPVVQTRNLILKDFLIIYIIIDYIVNGQRASWRSG